MRISFYGVFLIGLMCLASSSFAAQSRVVAVVNGEMISSLDLEKKIKPILIANNIKSSQTDAIDEIAKKALEEMVSEQVLLQEAKKTGINIPDAFAEEQLATQIASSNKKEEDFYKDMEKKGITKEYLLNEIKTSVTIQRLIDRNVSQKIIVPESEIEAYFNGHKNDFKQAAGYNIAILVYPDSETAKKYSQMLAKKEVSFTSVVKQVSVGPNPKDGGEMGYMEKGDISEGLVAIVQDMKPGDVSPLLSFGDAKGQVSLLAVDYLASSDMTLDEEIREKILQVLREPYWEKEYANYIEKLNKKAIISIRY